MVREQHQGIIDRDEKMRDAIAKCEVGIKQNGNVRVQFAKAKARIELEKLGMSEEELNHCMQLHELRVQLA